MSPAYRDSDRADESKFESCESSPVSRRAVGEAIFLFTSIAMRRGGLTRAILDRMHLFAESGIPVRLLLTEHTSREDAEEAAIRQAWDLPDSVEIRYFWREAAPEGGGAQAGRLAAASQEPGLTSFTETTRSGTLVRFFDEGRLTKTKSFGHDAHLVRIDHHDSARRVVTCEYFDANERMIRADDLNPETGQRALRRWFDRSGACWLTSWLDKNAKPAKTVRHRPTPTAYDTFVHCVAEWVDDVLSECQAPVVFCDKRDFDPLLLAVQNRNAHKVAVLHNSHTSEPHRAEDETKASWLPLMDNIDRVDRVVTLTRRQRDDIARRYPAGNLTVINHPTPPPPAVRVERDPALLVAVARLETQKRLEHAIRAFAIAGSQVPQARFDIFGTGPEAGKLKKLVTELGLGGRVRFPGFTDRPLEVFAGAAAAVLSSRFEGWGLVLTEAMGVGTPVVAYDINYGPDEVIRDEVDGLLVRPGDIDTLAAAMVRVLADPPYARSLGERALEVTERFSYQRWQRDWLELFETLCAEPVVAPAR